MDPTVLQLTASLAEVAARQSAAAVATRVSTIKKKKDYEEAVNELQEIINELVRSRDEILSIAQGLKEQLVAQQISDEDITYVVETIIPALRKIFQQDGAKGVAEAEAILQQVEVIISTDTLRMLQTLGFNYRDAIGRPLTELVRNFLMSQLNTVNHEREVELLRQRNYELNFEISQDADSHSRLMKQREIMRGLVSGSGD